jgi:hypothetical protein
MVCKQRFLDKIHKILITFIWLTIILKAQLMVIEGVMYNINFQTLKYIKACVTKVNTHINYQ